MTNIEEINNNWELVKTFAPVLITVAAMWFVDYQNKRRWLKDGYLKRQIELEIEIRKYLLALDSEFFSAFDIKDLENLQTCQLDEEYAKKLENNKELLEDFNKNFEQLYNYLNFIEQQRQAGALKLEDTRIITLINEYSGYNPKLVKNLKQFGESYLNVSNLRTVYKHDTSESTANILYGKVLLEVKKRPEHFQNMLNCYINLKLSSSAILNKIKVKIR